MTNVSVKTPKAFEHPGTVDDVTYTTETTQNKYGASGKRIERLEKGITTRYYYTGDALLYSTNEKNVLETENILDPAGSVIASKRFLDPSELGTEKYANKYYIYNYDARSSVTNVIAPDGNVVKDYTYDEFGNTEASDSDFLNDITFTSSVADTSSNLQYMNSRFYQPSTGRFLSQDSYSGNAYDPWTQHLYSYCGNNPTSMIDPTGHFAVSTLLLIGIGVGALLGLGSSVYEDYKDDGKVFNGSVTANKYIGRTLGGAVTGGMSAISGGASSAMLNVFGNSMAIAAGDMTDQLISDGKVDYSRTVKRTLSGATMAAGFNCVSSIFSSNIGKPLYDTKYNTVKTENNTFNAVQEGPLKENVAKNFRSGSYERITLEKDATFYRVYGGKADKVGSYMSATPQNGGMQSQIDLALNPEWGNTATNVCKVNVPAGTTIYSGTAAPQIINNGTGTLMGGGSQIYIPRRVVNPAWFSN